ncbi:hypothetical protein Fmac_006099 [Flemingia macrophylla]|uniref:Uncharacterized protein n=1 Tax=Flemingia macrophylla TaxID=520843 RepID=A0ABD1N9M3_9FABA
MCQRGRVAKGEDQALWSNTSRSGMGCVGTCQDQGGPGPREFGDDTRSNSSPVPVGLTTIPHYFRLGLAASSICLS